MDWFPMLLWIILAMDIWDFFKPLTTMYLWYLPHILRLRCLHLVGCFNSTSCTLSALLLPLRVLLIEAARSIGLCQRSPAVGTTRTAWGKAHLVASALCNWGLTALNSCLLLFISVGIFHIMVWLLAQLSVPYSDKLVVDFSCLSFVGLMLLRFLKNLLWRQKCRTTNAKTSFMPRDEAVYTTTTCNATRHNRKVINVLIKVLDGRTRCLQLKRTDCVRKIILTLAKELKIPKRHIILKFRGLVLNSWMALSDYKIDNNCIIEMGGRLRGGQASVASLLQNLKGELFDDYPVFNCPCKWLSSPIKRLIHSILLMFLRVHHSGHCFNGNLDFFGLQLEDDRVIAPQFVQNLSGSVYNLVTPEGARKDYESLHSFLSSFFGNYVSDCIELGNFLDDLVWVQCQQDVCADYVQRYICNNVALKSSSARISLISHLHTILQHPSKSNPPMHELMDIVRYWHFDCGNPKWIARLSNEQPWDDMRRDGCFTFSDYAPSTMINCMRNATQHPVSSKNPSEILTATQVERKVYYMFGKLLHHIVLKLIMNGSDSVKEIEELSMY